MKKKIKNILRNNKYSRAGSTAMESSVQLVRKVISYPTERNEGNILTLDGMKYEGEFRGGRLWGHGLLTYSDGSPSSEGYFQESMFM